MTDEERLARLVLHHGKMGERARFARDLAAGRVSAREVLGTARLREGYRVAVSEAAARRAHGDWELARRLGVHILTQQDRGWPLGTEEGLRAPGILYALGDLADPARTMRRICLVGSRAATRWAVELTRACAVRVVERFRGASDAACVVSGGALGVDAAAHEGALAAGGVTWVFLGSGLLAPYPARNRGLFERVRGAGGCLFSANHLYGTPDKGYFVQRNAFMAACAQAVVVTEASTISGSLHTARFARAAGRPVWACPGSAGCNRLLLEGARPFDDPEKLVADIIQSGDAPTHQLMEPKIAMSGGHFPEEIAAMTGNTLTEVFRKLQIGELNGEVVRIPGGRYLNLDNPEWS
jgi:DNA processing protein